MKLRTYSTLLLAVVLFTGCKAAESSSQAQDTSKQPVTNTVELLKYQDEISVEFMKPRLTVFSADSMEGREAGTVGEQKAANYLAKQYRKMGLKPVGDDGSYFQHFTLHAERKDSTVFRLFKSGKSQKELIDRSVASEHSTANFIRHYGGSDSLKGKVVFAGFGVQDTTHGVQHLQGVDLKGKWVMVFQNIPHVANQDTLVSLDFDARVRFQAIMDRGATGMLLVPNGGKEKYETMAQKAQSSYGVAGSMSLAYRDKEGGTSGGFSRGYNVINPALAAQMLRMEADTALAGYRESLMDNIRDFEPELLDYELEHIPYSSKKKVPSKNVAAFHEGADPELKKEVVVLTSHYDHVGIGQPDSTGDRIYNGADDDGSGTIGLLNVAHAFAKAADQGIKPKRSILFLNVSGEEKGLLGSRYYSDHPIFPMEKTVANINTDMIGRIDAKHEKEGIEDYSYIIGADIISSELDSLIKAGNEMTGQVLLSDRYNDLQDPNQFYRRSDHWHFGRKRVPFVFFFTGVHEDYHRPSDEVHKIRFGKMTKIVRSIYGATVVIGNANDAPKVDNEAFIEITASDN